MRIISGEYRGRILKSPSNIKTRPTSDRLRETLFNVLNPKIGEDTRFLDLCAGTGAVGGAIAGATIGSVVPVVGTAIGGVVGAVGGAVAGHEVAENVNPDDKLTS